MKRRPESLYCYKENDIQKWIMSDRDNDKEIIMNILMNEDVDKSSIFSIPADGLDLLEFPVKNSFSDGDGCQDGLIVKAYKERVYELTGLRLNYE